jgi:hypothetical protein
MEYFLRCAQLLRFSLLSTLEIIVGPHKEKPSMLPIADRTFTIADQVFRLGFDHVEVET